MREKLTHYIRAGYAGLYLVSHEEQRVEAELKAIAGTLKHRLYAWSATAGLIDTSDGTSRGAQDPMEVLGVLAALPKTASCSCAITMCSSTIRIPCCSGN